YVRVIANPPERANFQHDLTSSRQLPVPQGRTDSSRHVPAGSTALFKTARSRAREAEPYSGKSTPDRGKTVSETRVVTVGDQALMVVFGHALDPRIHRQVRSFTLLLEKQGLPGMVEYVPSFTGVTLYYDPSRVELSALLHRLEGMLESLPRVEVPPP